MVVPAWVAKHKVLREECNMSRVDFQVDVVNAFAHGDSKQFATSSVVSVPVFSNFIGIDPGNELVVHWDKEQVSGGGNTNPKKQKTWKTNV